MPFLQLLGSLVKGWCDLWIDNLVAENCRETLWCRVWTPDKAVVVVGKSNKIKNEVDDLYCENQQVEILRRSGGGGAVVLYPGTVIVSAGVWVKEQFQNKKYFDLINLAVVDSLSAKFRVLKKLSLRGISDIAYEDWKVAGTSMFRSRNYLLYQGSILVDLDLELIGKCLRHPTAEPDYRAGRSHENFVMGLAQVSNEIKTSEVRDHMEADFKKRLKVRLNEDLFTPTEKQIHYIKKRFMQ